MTADEILRHFAPFRPDDPDQCWLWLGALNGGGYGVLPFGGKRELAHRFAFETWVGPIPDGLHLDHLCRERRCIRPSHLEPVTITVNSERVGLRRIACKRGHLYDETTPIVQGYRRCRACLSIRNRQYRERHPEQVRARQAAGYQKHREERMATQRAWNAANREHIAAYKRALRETDGDRIRAQKRAAYAANRDRINAQRKAERAAMLPEARAKDRAYYAANRERKRALKAAWIDKPGNRERVKAESRASYYANQDANQAKAREWYQANRDAINARRRAQSEANRDVVNARQRAWRVANPEKQAEITRRSQAKKRAQASEAE